MTSKEHAKVWQEASIKCREWASVKYNDPKAEMIRSMAVAFDMVATAYHESPNKGT